MFTSCDPIGVVVVIARVLVLPRRDTVRVEAVSAPPTIQRTTNDGKRDFFNYFTGLLTAIQLRVEPGTGLTRRAFKIDLTSADSGLQLDLEIALSGVPAKV